LTHFDPSSGTAGSGLVCKLASGVNVGPEQWGCRVQDMVSAA
jgi:hypothetical protein